MLTHQVRIQALDQYGIVDPGGPRFDEPIVREIGVSVDPTVYGSEIAIRDQTIHRLDTSFLQPHERRFMGETSHYSSRLASRNNYFFASIRLSFRATVAFAKGRTALGRLGSSDPSNRPKPCIG